MIAGELNAGRPGTILGLRRPTIADSAFDRSAPDRSAPDRSALGEFLRSRRARLSPSAAGLSDTRRRRTPGLRREEVAELAGIGVDWYVRLEQGRPVTPSASTVDALARALRLTGVEREHLRALAGAGAAEPFVRETAPPSLVRLVRALPHPAYVTGRRYDVLAWNDAAADLLLDFGAMPADDRNILLHILTNPDARRLFGEGWAAEAKRVVAQFRATSDLWAGDPAFTDLLERLRTDCPEFEGWWGSHDISKPTPGRKTLHHPVHGALRFDYATFHPAEAPTLRLAIYTPV